MTILSKIHNSIILENVLSTVTGLLFKNVCLSFPPLSTGVGKLLGLHMERYFE